MKTVKWAFAAITTAALALPWMQECKAGTCLFGIDKKTGAGYCVNIDCMPPDMCTEITIKTKDKNGNIIELTSCACLPPQPHQPPPPKPAGIGGELTSSGLVALTNGVLSFTGDVITGSSFASDPVVGSSVTFSGGFNLTSTGTNSFGVAAALFRPLAPTTFDVGNCFSGTVECVQYIESDSENRFDVLVSSVVAGTDAGRSPFAQALFAPDNVGLVLSFLSPTPLFSDIEAGSFGPRTMPQLVIDAVPEPPSSVLAGVALLLGMGVIWRRAQYQRGCHEVPSGG